MMMRFKTKIVWNNTLNRHCHEIWLKGMLRQHQLSPSLYVLTIGGVPAAGATMTTDALLGGPNPSSDFTPLVLSPAAKPFPGKLVDKARSRQFVEMWELLADNIALLHQLEAIHGNGPLHTLGPAQPQL